MIKLENLTEIPIKIVLNGDVLQDLLCTPKDIEKLFTGWLLSQGYVEDISQIHEIKFIEKKLTVHIKADCSNIKHENLKAQLSALSDIVAQTIFSENENNIDGQINETDLPKVRNYGKMLADKRVKGLHAALLCDDKTIIFNEDVSRHCAIDKVLGQGAMLGVDMTKCTLVTTGRISSEFLFKVKMLEIPMIASLKYPSLTGKIIADKWKINIATHINTENAQILEYK